MVAPLAVTAMVLAVAPTPAAQSTVPAFAAIPCAPLQWEDTDPTFDPLPGAKAYFGKYDGGLYRIEIPDTWNGELVLYAHGYQPATATGGPRRVGLSVNRQHYIEHGVAWAASSFRCNGYVPGIGLEDTMALMPLFTKINGTAARRVYLSGTSMGGHITLLGLHQFPTAFAGGLAMCASGPELFDFFTSVAAAAEAVTGVTITPATRQQDVAKMRELLGQPPNYTEQGKQLASLQIDISGGPRPFALDGLAPQFISNITTGLDRTSLVNRAATNAQTKYRLDESLGLTADVVNARVRRVPADATLRGAGSPHPELPPFTGRIERPLVTLHGTGDLFVPIVIEQQLARAVTAAGRSQFLAQRIIRSQGHCAFSAQETATAFDDLVAWVRDGKKAAGDDVLGDLSDAGRTFTNPLRANDPGAIRVRRPGLEARHAAGPDRLRQRLRRVRRSVAKAEGPAYVRFGPR